MASRPSKIATPQRAKQFAEEDARYSNIVQPVASFCRQKADSDG
jgi:hypothetical protein